VSTSTPIASTSKAPSAVVGELDAGGAGWAMTKAAGALWIQVDAPVDAIVRIDATTGTAAPAVPGGWRAKAGTEGLWAVCCDWLVRIDPATGTETLRVPMGGALALGGGSVWLYNDDGLHRIDASTGTTAKPIGPGASSVCDSTKDLAIAFESAWVACKEGHVVRIDLATGESTSIPTGAGAHTIAVTQDAVWVTNYEDGTVSRIDPVTDHATSVPGAGSGVGITTGGGFVWASTTSGIAKIDPVTGSILGVVDLGPGEYYELVWDDGIIWVSTRGSRVLKVDTAIALP
jgi:streptogramin lyase